jgi:hypothetical protein
VEKKNPKQPAPRSAWTGPHLPPDLERMDGAARLRYLERRLMELELLIDAVMQQRHETPPAFTLWDIASPHSDLWQDAMNLTYLEASRRAILETLAEMKRPS